jgi:hypothetical protein
MEMRSVLTGLLVILLVSCNNSKDGAPEEKIVSKHSEGFNAAVETALDSYHALTEAFVNWDSTAVINQATDLKAKLNNIPLDELQQPVQEKAKTDLNLAQQDIAPMLANVNLTEKRYRLNALTQNLYDLLNVVQYDNKKIYLNECPMAFNDTEPGDWLSETDSIRNPYLGLHHPRYGKAMIECGETKSTLDYTRKK